MAGRLYAESRNHPPRQGNIPGTKRNVQRKVSTANWRVTLLARPSPLFARSSCTPNGLPITRAAGRVSDRSGGGFIGLFGGCVGQAKTNRGPLAPRGESLAAFDGRCILAGCVAPSSNIPDILGRRALPSGRRAPDNMSPNFGLGTLAWAVTVRVSARVCRRSIGEPRRPGGC